MADTHIKIKPVVPRVQYVGNGVTTDFAYSFAIFDETDMQVYIGDTLIDPDATVIIGEGDDAVEYPVYTITGVGEEDGGEVIFTVAPENDAIITLVRNVPVERMTDFQEGGTFRPKNLNDELDRQTAFCQQIEEALNRCVKVDVTSQIQPSEILPQIERLYESVDNIDTVSEHVDEIDTVSNNMTDVNNCSTNMAAIQDAPTQASNAAGSANDSALSAQQAAISAASAMPPPLFHHQWEDHLVNNISWLRADTFSWQDGTVYSAAYNHLVNDNTNGTAGTDVIAGITIYYVLGSDGHKIVLTDGDQTYRTQAVEALYNATGVAWYYILDTTNQRFKLPRTKFGFTGLRDTVGKYVPAGLPDHNHYYDAKANHGYNGSTVYEGFWGNGDAYTGSTVRGTFSNASSSNSIYGNSTTVQPPATQMYLYFYVGQYTQTATEQTAGLNSELFNGKLDLDASNLSTQGKSLVSGLGMPSSRYIDLTLGASGTYYTAPANGYIQLSIEHPSGSWMNCVNVSDGGNIWQPTTSNGACSSAIIIPVRKGLVWQINYSTVNTSVSWFRYRFVYAQGEENV